MKHVFHCKLALIKSFKLEDQGGTLTQESSLLLLSLIPKLLLVERESSSSPKVYSVVRMWEFSVSISK